MNATFTPGEMSIERFILVLRTHIKLVVGVFVLSVSAAVLITLITPEIYIASTSLNFDIKSANPLDSRGRSLESDAYLTTQIDIIKSQNVAQKVQSDLSEYEFDRFIEAVHAEKTIVDMAIQEIKSVFKWSEESDDDTSSIQSLAEDGALIDVVPETIDINSAYSWMTQVVGVNLIVEPRLNSRVVDLIYSSTDPRIAALMANKFADAYLATNLEMTIDPVRKTSKWYDEQLKDLRGKLEGAQSKLTTYQQQEGIVSSDERMDTETSRLQKLSDQLVVAQQDTRKVGFSQKKLQEIIKQGIPLTTLSLVFNNDVVKKIKSEIRRQEGELVDISASLGSNHPRRKKVASELQATRARLSNEMKIITDGIYNTAALAKERELDLSRALEEQKKLVLDLKHEHNRITVLKREVESANKTYNAALTQLNTTSMQSLVNQTNVSVIDPANIPGGSSSPKLTKNLAIGGLVGLLLGVGLAIFLEMLTRRVHSKDDLLVELRVPVLGHLKRA